METLTTHGIRISVIPNYAEAESAPRQQRYSYSYRIIIENTSRKTVQLIERHWHIYESNGLQKEVKGQGVVGEQPVLSPGGRFEYTSWCALLTDIGKMCGTYTMLCVDDGSQFVVSIPGFSLYPPFKMN